MFYKVLIVQHCPCVAFTKSSNFFLIFGAEHLGYISGQLERDILTDQCHNEDLTRDRCFLSKIYLREHCLGGRIWLGLIINIHVSPRSLKHSIQQYSVGWSGFNKEKTHLFHDSSTVDYKREMLNVNLNWHLQH